MTWTMHGRSFLEDIAALPERPTAKDYLEKTQQSALHFKLNVAKPLSQVTTPRRRRCHSGSFQAGGTRRVGRDVDTSLIASCVFERRVTSRTTRKPAAEARNGRTSSSIGSS
jgi:hypothetical protein